MYWTVNYLNIGGGGVPAYKAWAAKYAEWLKAQQGFQARAVYNSYSYPAQYFASVRWESRDAARAATTGEGFSSFLASNPPPSVLTFRSPAAAFDSTLTVGDMTKNGKVLFAAEWNLDMGKSAAFEKRCTEMFGLHQRVGRGFGFGRVLRRMGQSLRCVVAWTYSSREDLLAVRELPEIQEFNRTHPHALYASERPVADLYEVFATT